MRVVVTGAEGFLGRRPAVVDLPTGWAHSIESIGDEELITIFWAHELFDPDRPDTYREVVTRPSPRSAPRPSVGVSR